MLKDLIKPLISGRTRSKLARIRVQSRRPTAALRRLPDFMIIGGMRCGTSSLYRYLGSHPEITPSIRKETEFFSRNFDLGVGWYRAHFPLRALRKLGLPSRSFEATPYYLLHPHAPIRAAQIVPAAKLIVMLRDPTARAFSHHQHMFRLGLETLDFEDALEHEAGRTDDQWRKLLADPDFDSLTLHRHSYMRRGEYVAQIRRWLEFFPRENMLFVQFEKFFSDPREEYGRILDFLEVSQELPPEFRNFSYLSAKKPSKEQSNRIPDHVQSTLRDHFRVANAELGELIGELPPW